MIKSVELTYNLNSSNFSVISQRKGHSMTNPRLMVVEDEVKLLNNLISLFSEEGFEVSSGSTFLDLEALLVSSNRRHDVIVLDRLLHGRDSADLIGRIKDELSGTKVLVLSAINTSSEKASVLDKGADDYLAKPFSGEELVARVRALLRRDVRQYRLGNLMVDEEKRIIRVGAQESSLTNKEFDLLKTFVKNPGKVFSKAILGQQIWELSVDAESNVVEATVNKVRRRLEELGATSKIKNTRNAGYWIEE